jgi:hypothetical protein
MSALQKIASAMGHADERLNLELAQQFAAAMNSDGVAEIVKGLSGNAATSGDCIKVMYEVGRLRPELIAPYAETFVGLLQSKNNRLVWGAMTALAFIAPLRPKTVFERLDTVIAAYEKGSVITVDNGISVFAALCAADAAYEERIMPLLLRHLLTCKAREIPQHLERIAVCLRTENGRPVTETVQARMGELTRPQQARIRKTLKELSA